jgi:Flp pilus assembly protein TadG
MLKQEGGAQDRLARGRPRQDGQATVELVLSLGVLLLLLLAALDFGQAFFGYIALVNAAREGARSGITSSNPAMIEPAVRQEIQGNNLDPARLTVQYRWGGSGQPLVVTVSYHFDLITTSILPFTQLNLGTSATMAIP